MYSLIHHAEFVEVLLVINILSRDLSLLIHAIISPLSTKMIQQSLHSSWVCIASLLTLNDPHVISEFWTDHKLHLSLTDVNFISCLLLPCTFFMTCFFSDTEIYDTRHLYYFPQISCLHLSIKQPYILIPGWYYSNPQGKPLIASMF